jgi:hypothetical protein
MWKEKTDQSRQQIQMSEERDAYLFSGKCEKKRRRSSVKKQSNTELWIFLKKNSMNLCATDNLVDDHMTEMQEFSHQTVQSWQQIQKNSQVPSMTLYSKWAVNNIYVKETISMSPNVQRNLNLTIWLLQQTIGEQSCANIGTIWPSEAEKENNGRSKMYKGRCSYMGTIGASEAE